MLDVVIPLIKHSAPDFDLRYCLRSIEKHLADLGNVFIIGGEPDWITNHIHIDAMDLEGPEYKAQNIFQKICMACNDQRVSDDFYCTADDNFLLKEYVKEYNYRGMLGNAIGEYNPRQTYRQVVMNTYRYLNGGRDYGHGPIVYNKKLFLKSVPLPPWTLHYGYSCKCLYCNLNNLEGIYYEDVKINSFMTVEGILERIKGRPYFSISEYAMNDAMAEVLHELYPVKSQFEK